MGVGGQLCPRRAPAMAVESRYSEKSPTTVDSVTANSNHRNATASETTVEPLKTAQTPKHTLPRRWKGLV